MYLQMSRDARKPDFGVSNQTRHKSACSVALAKRRFSHDASQIIPMFIASTASSQELLYIERSHQHCHVLHRGTVQLCCLPGGAL